MTWYTLKSGKFKGKSLPQVVFADPDWFFEGMERHGFKGNGALAGEAQSVYEKARSIKIPVEGDFVAEYSINPCTGKFNNVSIVPRSDDFTGSTIRRNFIDMGIPHDLSSYDKQGNKWLINDVKRIVFGKANAHLKKKRCEEFFDNAWNFQ